MLEPPASFLEVFEMANAADKLLDPVLKTVQFVVAVVDGEPVFGSYQEVFFP